MKVLVGCPTFEGYDYCIDEYLKRVRELSFKTFDLILVDNSETNAYAEKLRALGVKIIKVDHQKEVRSRIAESRNVLREYVLKNDYDYFLSLEQDVIPPRTVVQRLLRHQKKVVSGIYFKIYTMTIPAHKKDKIVMLEKKVLTPLVFRFSNDPNKMHVCNDKDVEGEKLLKIRACGLGCVLIHRDVLEKVKFRTEEGSESFDDLIFCTDVYENGFDIYADTSVKCRHMLTKKGKDIYK